MIKIKQSTKFGVGLFKQGNKGILQINNKTVGTFDDENKADWHYKMAIRLVKMCG